MYTIRSDKPLDRITLVVLKALHMIAAKHKANYFIIGATARDILMTHVFGIHAGRATRDVDFAIALEDWNQFDIIKKAFIDGGDFQSVAGESHRLYFKQNEFGTAYPLDLIPFGRIERAGNRIAWPAASSLALLMRRPEDRRWIAVVSDDCDLTRLFCVISESELVLMIEDMVRLLCTKVDGPGYLAATSGLLSNRQASLRY